ncbi:ADP-ribosyltransferase [Paludibacterium paludis]|uniref:ADP ribosyltransferase domain-containing protein n=1 Tax=Paludibacterium paludis TaxID=1225769 RepID=A0A918P052_9NEIS|nr:ADP-ribosyltransferase [Paludibacterium paludis]GGY09691.1 hypothetical protein GCM10011289_10690 [Paludibacterium paludis]
MLNIFTNCANFERFNKLISSGIQQGKLKFVTAVHNVVETVCGIAEVGANPECCNLQEGRGIATDYKNTGSSLMKPSDMVPTLSFKDSEWYAKNSFLFDKAETFLSFYHENSGSLRNAVEGYKKYSNECKDERIRLDFEEYLAVRVYSDSHYKEINNALRGIGEDSKRNLYEQQGVITALKRAIEKLSTSEVAKTFRGENSVPFEMREGDEVAFSGFISTARKVGVVDEFTHSDKRHNRFVVFGKTGARIDNLSNFPEEKELLYKDGTRFNVVFRHDPTKLSWPIKHDDRRTRDRKPLAVRTVLEEVGLPGATGKNADALTDYRMDSPKPESGSASVRRRSEGAIPANFGDINPRGRALAPRRHDRQR